MRTLTPAEQLYVDGLIDGCEIALRMLVGAVLPEEEDSCAPAPQEHVGPELREWARKALARNARGRRVTA